MIVQSTDDLYQNIRSCELNGQIKKGHTSKIKMHDLIENNMNPMVEAIREGSITVNADDQGDDGI